MILQALDRIRSGAIAPPETSPSDFYLDATAGRLRPDLTNVRAGTAADAVETFVDVNGTTHVTLHDPNGEPICFIVKEVATVARETEALWARTRC